MSIQAIAWVFSQEIHPSQAKFVLVALANYCHEDCLVWPCVQTICDITSQDDKTVRRALKQLEEMGHIHDTGERVGMRSQIKVYRLRLPDAVLLKIPKYGYRQKSKIPKYGAEGTRISPEGTRKRVAEPYNNLILTNSDKSQKQNVEVIAKHLAKLKGACK